MSFQLRKIEDAKCFLSSGLQRNITSILTLVALVMPSQPTAISLVQRLASIQGNLCTKRRNGSVPERMDSDGYHRKLSTKR